MANIAQITLPSGTTYDIKDSVARLRSVEYIVGTQTSATASWKGVTTDAELYTGKSIAYKLPVASASGAVTLNLTLADGETTTGAITVLMNGTTNVGTAYAANSVVHMTYDGTNWRIADYYVSNSDSQAYLIRYGQNLFYPQTALYRYQILFTYDDTHLLPANAVNNSTATTKTLTTESFDPFGQVYYYNKTTTVATTTLIPNGNLWTQRNDVDLRYGFNTGTTLTASKFVYLVCAPQSDGKVKLHSSPITQTLPSTEDGLVYKLLGKAYSTSNIQMFDNKPCYYYKNGAIREWTNPVVYTASDATPLMDGTATAGTSAKYAREGHVHPTDTTRAPLASPALTGTPTAPTASAGTNTTQVATTAFVKTAVDDAVGTTLSITIPVSAWSNREATVTCQGVTTTSNILVTSDPSTMEAATASGVYCSAQGTNTLTFTCMGEEPEEDLIMDIWIGRFLVDSASYAPISSPTFTGTPTAPTAAAGTSSTQIATTAFVMSAIGSSGLTPSSTDPLMDGTATSGTSVEYARGDHVHPTDTSRAAASHTHGNITNDGKITASGVAIAANDTLVIVDASDSSKLKQTSIKFDGSTTTKALTPKGTFETFITSHQSLDAYATKASPAFTGTPTAPTATAGTNTTQIATTAFVKAAVDAKTVPVATTTTPKMDGTAAVGSETKWAKGDHVHPTDTSRAPLASPALTGTPTAPTATAGTSSTQIATTAFVGTAVSNAKPTATSVSVATSAWSNLTATVNVTGVTANNNVLVSPDPASRDYAVKAQMYCSAQGAGTLTFKCKTVPTNAVTVNVMIFN